MEYGSDHRMTSGWLNRVAGVLPAAPGQDPICALAVGTSLPLLLRGPALWSEAGCRRISGGRSRTSTPASAALARPRPAARGRRSSERAARARGSRRRCWLNAAPEDKPGQQERLPGTGDVRRAGKLLAARRRAAPRRAGDRRLGHAHARSPNRLAGPLQQLDAGLLGAQGGPGRSLEARRWCWCMTEFGRTVRSNGTQRHRPRDRHGGLRARRRGRGRAGAARTGRGWRKARLFENRDLQPTADLRSVAKGLLAQHMGLDASALALVFPDSAAAGPMRGLVRATA